ncbi:MAG: hypothetical protein PHT00_00310 [Candidatus Methanomethylophilus sp.]|nr:hypothetical protein [Methanomethylophilus sp.]
MIFWSRFTGNSRAENPDIAKAQKQAKIEKIKADSVKQAAKIDRYKARTKVVSESGYSRGASPGGSRTSPVKAEHHETRRPRSTSEAVQPAAARESNFTQTNISRYHEPGSKVTAAQRAGQLKTGKGMGR